MIITNSETKLLLDNSSLSDNLINALIPIIEKTICDYCNQDFIQENFDWFGSNDIYFLSSDNSINYTGIENKKLIANDSIYIHNSLRNDGHYTVSSITTNKIILNSIDSIIDENESQSITIFKVNYPKSFKFLAAQMIKFNIDGKKIKTYLSEEEIDDYRYKLAVAVNGYPSNSMSGLKQYRQLYKKSPFPNVNICCD